MYWLLSCIILTLVTTQLWWRLKKFFRKYKLIFAINSCDKNWPIIGAAHLFVGDTEGIMNSLQEISKEASEKGGIMNLWLGPLPYIMLTNSSIIDTVLKHHLEKGDTYEILRTATGNATLFAPEAEWKNRRKILSSVLHPKFVTKFFDVFLKGGLLLSEKFDSQAGDNKPFGLWPHLNTYSFDSIWEISMGTELSSMKEFNNVILETLMIVKNCLSMRCFQLWQYFDLFFRFHRNNSIVKSRLKIANSLIDEAIKMKKHEIEIEYKSNKIENLIPQETRYRLFELLWNISKRSKEYNDLELREELIALIVAATDTTATTIGFILKLLGKYPSVQEKVYNELCAAFQDQNMLPNSTEDLMKLEYTERVINETLRLYPAAPIIQRKTKSEILLENGVILPEGCSIVVLIWGLHRNKEYWGKDAEAFDPDRFLPERYSHVPPGSFIPFSSGPRRCPGYGYSMMSIKTALSIILKRYKVVSNPEAGPIPQIKLKCDITLTPVDDTITLERRY